MFRNRWNLQESPFRGTLDWRRFFAAPTHEEALARLHFLVDEARPLGLLLGPTGSGKSLILEVFARQLLRSGAQVANVNLSRLDLHEFLWLIAAELGINPDRREDPFRLWRGVLDRLTENRYQQLPTVLLLDDVDEAAAPVLDHVARLAQINNTPRGRLSIVLSANGHALGRLTPRLLELAELRSRPGTVGTHRHRRIYSQRTRSSRRRWAGLQRRGIAAFARLMLRHPAASQSPG